MVWHPVNQLVKTLMIKQFIIIFVMSYPQSTVQGHLPPWSKAKGRRRIEVNEPIH